MANSIKHEERDKARSLMASFSGTQCALCGNLARNGLFCENCRNALTDHELEQAWRDYCLPSGFEQDLEAICDMAP